MNTPINSRLLLRVQCGMVLLALLAFFSPTPLCAQVVTSTLPIRVTDPQGAVVPNATITVENLETGLKRTATTNEEGLATFSGLPVGTYKITVEVQGFKTLVKEREEVGVSRSQILELRMEVGAITEPLSVTAATELSEDPLADLPNLNQDLSQLLRVVPGAAAGAPSLLGRIVPDGRGKEQLTFTLDKLDVTPPTDLPAGDPSHGILDTFLKINVALNGSASVTHAGTITFEPAGGDPRNYALSSMYGPGTGTLLEGKSYKGNDGKPGFTQLLKIHLYEAMRNDALNRRNFFESEGKNPLRRNQFGAKIGAPLPNGKFAFFFGYDGVRARSARNIFEAVPVDAFCLCGGGPVAPLLGGFLPPGTTIVEGDVSKNDAFLIAKRRVRTTGDGNAWDARFDFPGVLGFPDAGLSLRFTRQAAEFLLPDGVTGRQQRQGFVLANGVAILNISKPSHVHYFKFGISQTPSYSFVELLPSTDQSLSQALITVGSTVDVSGLPGDPSSIPVAALGGLIRNAGRGFDQTPISFNPGYDFVRIWGRHSMEAGFEARFIRMDFDRFGGLTYTFRDVPGLRSGTTRVVSFLSDLSGPSPFSSGGVRRAAQEYYLSYFQMRSQFSPRLLLTYGLRYDYFGAPRELNNRAIVIDPHTGETLTDKPFYRASKVNFQPRVGLSYAFANKSVLRVGAGIYSGTPRIGDLLLPIESDRFNTGRNNGTFPLTPAEVIKEFENENTRQFQPLSFSRDFTTPERIYRWDAMLTHTFKRVNDLNLIYSGSIGRNLPVAGISNQIISVQTNPDPTQPAIVRRQFDFDENGELFKPFGELQFRSSKGRSSFNGLTVQFKRTNVRGLETSKNWLDWQNFTSFNAQYTVGRNVGNVSGAVAANILDFDDDFGFNASDVRHAFSLSTGYRLWDDLRGRNRRDIIWGWTIAPTITARSGFPLFVRLDRPDVVYVDSTGNIFGSEGAGRSAIINTPGGGATGGSRVPDLVPGANLYLRNNTQYLNPEAFAIPAPGQFGNLKRGQLRGPGTFQVDLALTRVLFYKNEIDGKHSVGADLKIEIFNIFNRVNFANPPVNLPSALGTSNNGSLIQPGVPFTRLAAGGGFGVFNAADVARQIQFSLIFKFNEGF